MIPPSDVFDLQEAFRSSPADIGVGLYNPSTGEIRIGSFDGPTQGQGHQGLANRLGIMDDSEWRGFLVSSDGNLFPTSHFNLPDGALTMKQGDEGFVRQELHRAGLLS